MDTLTAARAQMEVSLGFHMIFAALGISMPLLMVISEGLWLKTGAPHYRALALRWGKVTALTFAVGAVSGTALSFELGLLWPRFMAEAGATLGPAFALEGYAFFIEAIFVGLYLYGWERLSPRAHWLCGVPVALSGLASGVLVVAANAWMQTPVDPRETAAVFLSPAWLPMAIHSSLSCYIAVAFAAAGVYAVAIRRGRRDEYHRAGLSISMAVGAVAAALQLASGHLTAQAAAENQPLKLAAAEAHFETGPRAPILIGGLPDEAARATPGAIKIPGGLSLLAFDDPNAVVAGLDSAPRELWPNVALTHLAFDVMVGAGMLLIALGGLYWLSRLRARRGGGPPGPLLLAALALASPLGFIALEAGWVVSEAGRQPWAIYGVLKTKDAVTPAAGVPATFFAFALLYLALGVILVALLRYLAKKPIGAEGGHAP